MEHAMGVTCHKLQRKICDNLELNLKSKRRVHGLAYVSLTRCGTENGNSFIYPRQQNHIYVDPNLQLEMTRLRKTKPREALLSLLESHVSKIIFHNVQSLRKLFSLIRVQVLYENCSLLIYYETFLNHLGKSSDFQLPCFHFHRFDYTY